MTARALPLLLALLAGCESTPTPPGQAEAGASPNATLLPAPLATEAPDYDGGARSPQADSTGRAALPDAGQPPPDTMHPSTPLPPESLPYQQTIGGVSLDGVFRWRDVPPPPRAPEVSADGLREAQKLTALTLKVDLSESGRMRAELTGVAFPLPAHSEIRARSDHYGNLLMWPNNGGYRVVPPGALRTLLGERRIDVTPLSVGTVKPQGEAKRLGLTVRKVEVVSSVASVKLEIAKIPESGEGGSLLCRALVELGGVDPKSPVCASGEVVLAATYAWQEGGGISFEVTAFQKRTDLPINTLLVPPPGINHIPTGLPAVPHGIFLSREALMAFRTTPLQLPPVRDPTVPGEGFVAVNHTDRLMYMLLDGVPAVQVPAHGEQYVIGPPRGRYLAQWRTFLGEKVAPAQTIEMPARLSYGGVVDGGAPDGG